MTEKANVYVNPESGLKLTRAQRRQVLKNTDSIDRIVETDRKFFRRFPDRRYRVRLAAQVEIEQACLVQGETLAPPPGFQFYFVVHHAAPGLRMKLLVPIWIGSELDEMDPESKAREVWERSAPPKVRAAAEALQQDDKPA